MNLKFWLSLVILWVLMSAFGVGVYETTKRVIAQDGRDWVSVGGLDGDVYLRRYCNFNRSLRFRKRHPAESIVAAPMYIVGLTVKDVAGEDAAKIAMVLGAAALGVFTVYLLWLVTADLGAVALWVSFAWVWMLASAPELLAMSQAVLIGILLMVRRRVTDLRMWGGMALLAGGITITNAIKPVAALFCTTKFNDGVWRALRQNWKLLVWMLGGIVAVFSVFEILRWGIMGQVNLVDEFNTGWGYITWWLRSGFSFGERVRRVWECFMLEPMMTHGVFILPRGLNDGVAILPLGYWMPLPHVIGAIIAVLCGWSAWKNRCDAVVRAALVMASFDVMLHVIIGWGMVEAQIYCAHWFYIIPVLLAGVKGQWWKFALAAVIAAWNLQYLGVLV